MPSLFKKSTSFLGDSLKLLRTIPDHTFDVCIADPPYNMAKKKGLAWAFSSHVTMQETWDQFSDDDYYRFSVEWLTQARRVLKPNGNLFVFGTYHNIYTLGFILQQMDLKILNSIIWVKPNAQPNITCRMLTESSEQMIWACNNTRKKAAKWKFNYVDGKQMNGGKQMRNIWTFPITARSERVAAHPSQKPLALLERVILLASSPGDWILDPFAGVGSTAVAAARNGRNFVVVEKLPRYFDAQKTRFAAAGLADAALFTKATAWKAPRVRKAARAPDKVLIETA